jgi:DNA-binding NarL/FixJ family response regulator
VAQQETSCADGAVQQAFQRIARHAGLTPCLEARLIEIAAGLTRGEIARRHGISVNTVKTEVRALLRAVGAHCRHEIEDAVTAARARAEDGATAEELYRFLLLRLE